VSEGEDRPAASAERVEPSAVRVGPAELLARTVAAIGPADPEAMAAARALQGRLTKPAGSLGVLEELSVRLAGLAGACPPPMPEPAALAVFAGDHGVHAQRVSPWPQEVTAQMVANFLAGGAVVNAFARQVGASVLVVDVGVASPLPGEPLAGEAAARRPAAGQAASGDSVAGEPARGERAPRPTPQRAALRQTAVRAGTRDFTVGPALTRDEVVTALAIGIEVANALIDDGAAALITGDMGIANTTPAAALTAAFTGSAATEVTGRGTGVDDATYAHKIAVVAAGLRLHEPDPADPIGVLAAVGGLEHAALAGFVLGAAARRTPVLIDGVIAASAALAAAALAPDAVAAMVAGHLSVEPGAGVALRHLGLAPLLDLELRLGEGTGALLALPLVGAAVRVLHEVATFDSAGVTEK
jgi:nicotinate-nucleotide--dimethylbenzimidazole phosphoribosyltransferase